MAKSRKDARGYVLHKGECQRKDGRYSFSYTFGTRKLTSIKYSDVKKFYYDMIFEKRMKACTLDNVHTQLHPAFQMAVRDGLIRVNPTDGVMAEIKKSHVWDKGKRRSLTVPQQKSSFEECKWG